MDPTPRPKDTPIRFTREIKGSKFHRKPGEVVPVDAKQAKACIEAGIAEPASPPTLPIDAPADDLPGEMETVDDVVEVERRDAA